MTIFLFLFGLLLLVLGAEALVSGASRLASGVGVSPLVIGLTVVAYGTSAPEMVVSMMSGLSGQGDIALGNVIGSNIFNILLILGISALITPLIVSRQLVRLDVPVMIGISILTFILCLDGKISRLDGMLYLSCVIAYTVFLFRQSRKEHKGNQDERAHENESQRNASLKSRVINVLSILGGLVLLVLGARWLVNGSVYLARQFGVSELVIGLTIVAGGTSLPEAATSIIASIRGQRDIAVGNVVGSNIFNILAVLGLASIVAPEGIHVSPAAQWFDIPVMIAVSVACLPVFFTGHIIARWEGALFLGYYAAYTLYLILAATGNASLPAFAEMMWFVMPLTVLTLLIISYRSIRPPERKGQ